MPYPFIAARWFTLAATARRVDLVVLHTAETPEGVDTARAVARYFHSTDNRVSAHYCVDSDEVYQCVRERDVAYAAPGANANGVHVELAGRAAQTAVDWHDAYSLALLATAAPLVADICRRHGLPVRYVNAAALKAGGSGARGITMHRDVSTAFRRSTHTDPGPNFPIVEFVNRVLGGSVPAPPPPVRLVYHSEADHMQLHDVDVPISDSLGHGHTLTDLPYDRLAGIVGVRDTDADTDGTYTKGHFAAAFARNTGGKVDVYVENGPNGFTVPVRVSIAD